MVAVQLEESGNRQMLGYQISGTDYSPHALGCLQLRAPVSTCIKLENEITDCLSTAPTRTQLPSMNVWILGSHMDQNTILVQC